ncbi:ankyrin repeat-containing domain protein [Aspergillus flavus]|uniref:Ankyrin repeat-containing domain protein n=1 Tax=Aspergillus flavus TaxID=5059 RepID=A0A5N6GJG7_ASPFL|nr:ankyrin repeat-containing domain protein [Aspergillus flavus]
MDPLSIGTGVIAIATLAAQTCSALSDLRSLCQSLPGRLHAVNNEVADLNFVLFQVSLTIEDRACLPENNLSALSHLLNRADVKLHEIKDIVVQLTDACRASRSPIFKAHAWRKEQGRLQMLQEDIRTIKANLNIMLGASNSQDMTKIRLDVEAISAVTLQSSQEQTLLKENFLDGISAVNERIARVEEMLQVQASQVQASQFKQPQMQLSGVRKVARKSVRLQVGYQPNIGTLLQLDTLRRVPDTAQCVSYALNGDIEGLKYLFENGLASPRDAGADADYRPIAASDNSPRNKACHFLLEGGLPDAAVEALRAITKNGYLEDFLDEAGFTKTHKIILGLSFSSLEDEIFQNPDDVNATDAMGRTPLAWAAARGDHRAIVTMLGHSADPNIMDVQLSGPLSNAASQGHTVAVRLLLEAGAQTDFPYPDGEKKGSPLNCAARNATDVLLLKSLLDFGADVDASGTDGRTSLIHAARTDNASFAMLLLEYGADINAISADGSTPLTTAITYNSHNVLRLILDRWHEYSTCPRLKGPHLLQIAALYADLETVRILAATDHFKTKHDKQYTLGDFGNRLRQRPDLTDDLAMAFDDLLGVINHVPSQEDKQDSILKSGILSCFPLRINANFGAVDHDPNSACSSNDSFCDAFEHIHLSAEDNTSLEKHPLVH